MKWSLTFQVRGEIAADQAGSSQRMSPKWSGHDAEDFRKLLIESGAVKRSPTETQKLGSRLGTYFLGASRLRRKRLRPGGMQGRRHPKSTANKTVANTELAYAA